MFDGSFIDCDCLIYRPWPLCSARDIIGSDVCRCHDDIDGHQQDVEFHVSNISPLSPAIQAYFITENLNVLSLPALVLW